MNKFTSKFYLVGIKGSGMSSLARILYDLGNFVMGSDIEKTFFTDESLSQKDIEVKHFNKDNITSEYMYIIGKTYNEENNEEVKEIIDKQYRYMYYHEFIEYYFQGIKIGICGSHGKSTVTKMISHLLEEKKVCSLSGDSLGYGIVDYKYFVFEACEYKNTFLNYSYDYLVVNNIDYDHPDFFKNEDEYIEAFNKVIEKAKYIIVNNDSINTHKLNHRNKYTFGKTKDNDLVIYKITEYKDGYIVKVATGKKLKENEIEIMIPFKGIHNVYNVIASYLVIILLNEEIDINRKLKTFVFPKRRMEISYYNTNVLIDDYAHHPTEIKCLIDMIKSKYKGKLIVAIFQPHTYSRTIAFEKEFQACFDGCDEVYYLPTFISRENYDVCVEGKVDEILKKYKKIDVEGLKRFEKYGDSVIVFIGAGDITSAKLKMQIL